MRARAQYVAEHLAYTYNKKEGEAAAAFLRHVRDLPKDAEGVWRVKVSNNFILGIFCMKNVKNDIVKC